MVKYLPPVTINFNGLRCKVIHRVDEDITTFIMLKSHVCYYQGIRQTVRRCKEFRLSQNACIYYANERYEKRDLVKPLIDHIAQASRMTIVTFSQAQSMMIVPDTIIVPDGQGPSFVYHHRIESAYRITGINDLLNYPFRSQEDSPTNYNVCYLYDTALNDYKPIENEVDVFNSFKRYVVRYADEWPADFQMRVCAFFDECTVYRSNSIVGEECKACTPHDYRFYTNKTDEPPIVLTLAGRQYFVYRTLQEDAPLTFFDTHNLRNTLTLGETSPLHFTDGADHPMNVITFSQALLIDVPLYTTIVHDDYYGLHPVTHVYTDTTFVEELSYVAEICKIEDAWVEIHFKCELWYTINDIEYINVVEGGRWTLEMTQNLIDFATPVKVVVTLSGLC